MLPTPITTATAEAHDRPLSTAEVSELTGIPAGTLRQYRHKSEGPRSWKLAGRVRYDRADVLAWMEAQRAATLRGGDLPAA